MNKLDLIELYQDGINCRSCFEKFRTISQKNVAKGAQPRNVGKDYFSQDLKICIVLINPGGGHTPSDGNWDDFLQKLKKAKSSKEKEASWDSIQNFISKEEKFWGKSGAWNKLYYDSLGLDKDNIAMVNIMLCAVDKDEYKKEKTLDFCFFYKQKSLNILKALNPDKIILSGVETINFFRKDKEPIKSLGDLREKRNNYRKRVFEVKGKEELKKIEFQKIPTSKIDERIQKIFFETNFYSIGHYAARGSKLEDTFEDAFLFNEGNN